MSAAMKRQTLAFALLCVAAYGAQIVDCVALNRIGDAGIIIGLDVIWFVLLLALAGWSLVSIWHHWIRASAGVLVCVLCIYQHIQNTKIIW
jgi:hypothetical protein